MVGISALVSIACAEAQKTARAFATIISTNRDAMEPAGKVEPIGSQRQSSSTVQAEQDPRQYLLRAEEMKTLLAVQQAITSRLDSQKVLKLIAKEARRLTGADMGAVFLLKESWLEVSVVSGCPEDALLGYQIPLDSSLAGEAVRTGHPQMVADTAADGRGHRPLIEKVEARSVVIVPLIASCGPLGTITVASRSPGSLGDEACHLLQLLAPGAVIALQNARMYVQAQQAAALKERQRLVHDLHDSVTQTLFSANLIAEVLPRLWAQDPQEGQARLEELCSLTRDALAEMCSLLNASELESHGNPGS